MDLQAKHVDVQQELERMRVQVEDLRASLKRLVVATDADRVLIERELHDGLQQHLIALAVSLQLAGQAADSDPEAATAFLEEMSRDVQRALDATSKLAQRIYPAALEAGGLGALLRSAAVNAGVPASVDVAAPADHPPEVVVTLYLCWLNILACGSTDTCSRITVTESDNVLAFEVVGKGADADLVYMRSRVEALGGELEITAGVGDGTRICGSLPLSR